MKKVFVAYANDKMAYALERIGKQANALGIFDEVILYRPEMLPDYVRNSVLMQYSYGGGYWAWKPYIIYETLQKNEEGTIVCYVDAGATLRKGIEWTLYFELMKKYDFLCFEYRNEMPVWEKFGTSSTQIKHWGKRNTLLFLDEYIGTSEYREKNKIMGGCMFVKGRDNRMLRQWVDITMNHPEVIIDPSDDEMKNQYPFFAQHKHDQVVLTALAYANRDECLVLPELSETCGNNVVIYHSRFRVRTYNDYVKECVKRKIRYVFGDKWYGCIKEKLLRKL